MNLRAAPTRDPVAVTATEVDDPPDADPAVGREETVMTRPEGDARRLPVPASATDADAAWFTDLLRGTGELGPERRVVAVEPSSVGQGLVGESIRFALRYDGATGAPDSVVAKFPSPDPALRAAAAAELVYQREIAFYTGLAEVTDVRVPRCVQVVLDPDRPDAFLLVLEDLGPADAGDQIAGCSLERAEAVMDAAAALHAPLWGDDGLEDADWSVRAAWLPRIAESYAGLFDRYVAELGPLVGPEDLAVGEAFAPVIGRWFAGQPRPWTLTHGDFRLDNMLFDVRGGAEPVAVLDWQTILPGPGVADVVYFLGGCLTVDDRREHEHRLLSRYHAALLARGVRDYPFDRLLRDYRYNAFLGYFMATYAPLMVKRTARADRMFTEWLRRAAALVRDHDAVALLPT